MKTLLKKILLYVNIILAVLLVFSYLSGYISPAKFWPLAFAGLAYPYLLLVNFLFLMFWLFFRKKYLWISLLAIITGWNTMRSFVQIDPGSKKPNKEKYLPEQSIKILTFNVRAFNLYDWANNPSAREEIFDFISREDPDVLCLQEYYAEENGRFTGEDLLKKLSPFKYRHIRYTLGEEQKAHYGIATFSKSPVTGKGSIQFENTLNICIYTDILVAEDTLRIYNNHLQSINLQERNYDFIDSLKLRYNEDQITEIRDISSRLKKAFQKRAVQVNYISGHIKETHYPVVVVGDFNDTPASYAYRTMSKGLKDAFILSGSGFGRTYHGKFPSFRIDYILHSEALGSCCYERTKLLVSDHFPLSCRLYFR